MDPTIILVHGAFAESASWDAVIARLQADGSRERRVMAVPNPLRGLAADAESVADVVRTIEGPVLLVGHSYGGAVISNVPADAGDIGGLVYVAGFAPDTGEDCVALSQQFPGSTLGATLRPVPHADGSVDLYIDPELFHEQFCADLPPREAVLMAATQRPATAGALSEPSGEPTWRTVPSWFLVAGADRNIPAALQRFMAERAGARSTVEMPQASHAVAVSEPDVTAGLVRDAAAALSAA